MKMAVETAEKAARAQPLSPTPSWLLGALPHGDVIHGGGKTWLQTPPELGFKITAAAVLFVEFSSGT